jgi:lipoprotein-releasing system permease protein
MTGEALKGGARPFGAFERSLAMRYLRTKRQHGGIALISSIAMAGIAAAVFVLIVVMSVMNGFRTELLSRILGFSGHVYVLTDGLPAADVNAIKQRLMAVDGVVEAAPLVEGQGLLTSERANSGVFVRGIDRETLLATPLVSDNIVAGDIDTFGTPGAEPVVLLGTTLAVNMGVRPGDIITLLSPEGAQTPFGVAPRRKSYVVGGLFSAGMSEFDSGFVIMPLDEAQGFFGRGDGVDRIDLLLADPDALDTALPAIRQASGPTVTVLDWQQQNAAYVSALQIERNVMRLILMLIVAIAALNIISGLVMLVKNKGRDIAVLRTMGATANGVMRIFLMVGASIGVVGTVIGLVLGVLFCVNIGAIQDLVSQVTGANVFNPEVYFLSRIPARVEWTEVIGVTLFALLMSLLATLPPAIRAARLDPVEALRYE